MKLAAVRCTTLAVAIGLGATPAARGQGPSEVRGVWLNPGAFDSAATRAATLGKIEQARLNTLFLASPPIGANWGWSDPEDYAAMVADAKARGLAVHGWIANHWRSASPSADFTDPAERAAQAQWAVDLLTVYPDLDGVHFDYIRYRDWAQANAARLAGISETIHLARAAIDRSFPGKRLTATSFVAAEPSYHGTFPDWAGDVPQWYRDWYDVHPGNWYFTQGATVPALDPDWLLGPLFFNYQQNSPVWVVSGDLDAVIPMQYTSIDETWQAEADLWQSFFAWLGGGWERLAIGLGWLTEARSPGWRYDAPALVRHIKYGRSVGLTGFVIFQFGAPGIDDQPLIEALATDCGANDFDAPFATPATSWLKSSVCGNGDLEAGEVCDDGNSADGDGCDSNCTPTSCGNGILTQGEQCDDGNTASGDCCGAACDSEPIGSPCNDANPCTIDDACSAVGCAGSARPRSTCDDAGAGALRFEDSDEDAKDRLGWRWKKGGAVGAAEAGGLTGEGPRLDLCVFKESAGAFALILRAGVAGGGTCSGRPCWKDLGGTGLSYRSRSGLPDGIVRLKVKFGDADSASIELSGKGEAIAMPSLPLAEEGAIVAQLASSQGACWQTTLAPPAARNDPTRFDDKFPQR